MNNTIQITLTNLSDDTAFRHGYLRAEDVRRVDVTAIIAADQRKLFIPAEIAKTLGYETEDVWNVGVSDGKHTTCTTAYVASNSHEIIAGTIILDGLQDVIPLVGIRH
jgi:hypothetical protein